MQTLFRRYSAGTLGCMRWRVTFSVVTPTRHPRDLVVYPVSSPQAEQTSIPLYLAFILKIYNSINKASSREDVQNW